MKGRGSNFIFARPPTSTRPSANRLELRALPAAAGMGVDYAEWRRDGFPPYSLKKVTTKGGTITSHSTKSIRVGGLLFIT